MVLDSNKYLTSDQEMEKGESVDFMCREAMGTEGRRRFSLKQGHESSDPDRMEYEDYNQITSLERRFMRTRDHSCQPSFIGVSHSSHL